MNFKESIANYVLGNVPTHELIHIGEQALLEGYESESLVRLAGESAGQTYYPPDVERYFLSALDELGIALPDKQQASEILILYFLIQVLAGEVEPHVVLGKIYSDVYHKHGFDKDEKMMGEYLDISELLGIYHAYSDLQEPNIEYNGRKITKAEAIEILDMEAREEAMKYIERHGGKDKG